MKFLGVVYIHFQEIASRDGREGSHFIPYSVIPAKAGTQTINGTQAESLGPDVRRDDDSMKCSARSRVF
jgi:hypothetical protein